LHIQATALDSMQKVAEARKVMERCCQKFPGDATSWYLLGLGRAGEGDLIGGREALMKALSLEPQFESAQRNLNAIEAALEQDS
jgi:cytochrome c-type biogenesis protein CcmH/NrfG